MVGPPAQARQMLARRLPTILPPLIWDEAIDVMRIYSVAGLLNAQGPCASVNFAARITARAVHVEL